MSRPVPVGPAFVVSKERGMDTIPDIDARLTQAYEAYCGAIDAGKLDVADLAYAQMDRLLEVRISLPLQRS